MAYTPVHTIPWYPTLWANSAPNPPAVPIAGVVYRKSNATSTAIAQGQRYDQVYESALYNQFYWSIHAAVQVLQQCGIPFWDNTSPYVQGALTVGRDGKIYQAQQDIPANNSVQPGTNEQYWSTPQFGGEKGLVDLSNYIKWTNANLTYFVNPGSGNDNNDGLTAAKAKKTINGALAEAGHYYFNGSLITLELMPGNYGQVYINNTNTPNNCYVVLNGQSAGVVFNSLTFQGNNVSAFLIGNMTLNNAGAISPLQVAEGATVQCGRVSNNGRAGRLVFNNSGAIAGIYVNTGGKLFATKTDLQFTVNYTGGSCIEATNVSTCEIVNVGFYCGGSFGSVFESSNGSNIYFNDTITLGTNSGASCALSDGVFFAWISGSIYNAATWTSGGTWTGKKAKAYANGTILSSKVNPQLPGSGIEKTEGGVVVNIS